jgi:hypothetical protein
MTDSENLVTHIHNLRYLRVGLQRDLAEGDIPAAQRDARRSEIATLRWLEDLLGQRLAARDAPWPLTRE